MVLTFVAANSFAASAPTSSCPKIVALSVVAFLQTFQIIGYEKVLIVVFDWLHSRRDLVLCRVCGFFALQEFATKRTLFRLSFPFSFRHDGKHPKGQ